MPQLRRLAIAAEDPAKLAAFYQDVFELDQIDQTKGAVFLCDGTFNLALLPARNGMKTSMTPKATASTFRKKAGMCEATAKLLS